jgi:zinc and cadmium transporter
VNTLSAPFLSYLALVIVITLAGGLLPLHPAFRNAKIDLALSFGAGTLLGAAFFHMIPEVFHSIGDLAGLAILIGFLFLYTLEKFWMVHPCEETGCDFHRVGAAAFVGISIHSLLDGLALGSASLTIGLTSAVFLAIILHKMPAAITLSGILIKGGYSRKAIISMAFLFALTTPLGAILSGSILKGFSPQSTYFAIGIGAGTFISIAISDLLPQIHRAQSQRFINLITLFLAIFLMGIGRVLSVH